MGGRTRTGWSPQGGRRRLPPSRPTDRSGERPPPGEQPPRRLSCEPPSGWCQAGLPASIWAVPSRTASGFGGHDPRFKSGCPRRRPSCVSPEQGTCFPSSRGRSAGAITRPKDGGRVGGHPSGRPGHLTCGQGDLGAAGGGG